MLMEKEKIIPYITSTLIALVLFAATAFLEGLPWAESVADAMGMLSDSFVVPGVFLSGIGGLSWISSTGFFDIMSYGGSMLVGMFTRPAEPQERFYDYKVKKDENRKKWKSHFLVVGLICLAAGVVCLVVYFSLS